MGQRAENILTRMSREPFNVPSGTLFYEVLNISISGSGGFKSSGGLLGLGTGCLMYCPPAKGKKTSPTFICPLCNILGGTTFQPLFGEAGIKGDIVPLAEGGLSRGCTLKVTFRAMEFERIASAWVVAYACEEGKHPVSSLDEIAPGISIRPQNPAAPAQKVPAYVSPSAIPQYSSPVTPQVPSYPLSGASPVAPAIPAQQAVQQPAPYPQSTPAYPGVTIIAPPASIHFE